MPAGLSRQKELEIIKKAQKNLHHFSILYEQYFEKVYKFFHFRLRDEELSKDLTSETFEKIVTKLHTYEDQGYPFSSWIFRIARNAMIDHIRAQQSKHTTSLEELLPSQQPFTTFDPAVIDNQSALAKVKDVIKTLPQLQQDIWGLKLASDLSHRDIANILGISENYVNVSLFRSIKVIKSKLIR